MLHRIISLIFPDSSSADFGEKLRVEVEERLDSLHNVYAMEEVLEGIALSPVLVLFVN